MLKKSSNNDKMLEKPSKSFSQIIAQFKERDEKERQLKLKKMEEIIKLLQNMETRIENIERNRNIAIQQNQKSKD
jgi:uncharacterized protein YaaN involved in tellurite resistance